MVELTRVLERLRPGRVEGLLREAVNRYSPSYAEGPATEAFAAALDAAGASVTRQRVSDERENLIVRLGPDPVRLLWLGHVDTVAALEEEQVHARLDGRRLYGLGAADMKAGCAAAVEAVTAMLDAGIQLERGLCVALVVGEEEYGDGADALVDEVMAPLAVVGEPTGLEPCLEHYGYMELRLTSRGTRAHAALPEVGSSAIHAMLAWLSGVLEARHRVSQFERMAFNPRSINGGGALFAVAERCTAWLDAHFAPGIDTELVRRMVEAARRDAEAAHPGCRLASSVEFMAEGFAVDPGVAELEPMRRAFAGAGRAFVSGTFRSYSDASLLHRRGAFPVVCGPGRLAEAHTAHEHVSLDEVNRAAALYARIMVAACCGSLGSQEGV